MSSNSKLQISESIIEEGINTGKFIEDGIVVRCVNTGRIMKIKDVPNFIPQNYIQMNNNIFFMADISKIIDQLNEMKISEMYEGLSDKFSQIIDISNAIKDFQDIETINKGYNFCLEIVPIFDSKLIKEIDILTNKVNTLEEDKDHHHLKMFIGSIASYLKILFIYILTTHYKYKKDFQRDTLIEAKILNLENHLLNLYEQLLSTDVDEILRSIDDFTVNRYKSYIGSPYKQLLFENSNSDVMEKFLKYDRRIQSVSDLIHLVKGFNTSNPFSSVFTVNKDQNNSYNNSCRISLASNIFDILEDIQHLKKLKKDITSHVQTVVDIPENITDLLEIYSELDVK